MKLFTRTKIGNMTLKNRIIMCPMGNKTDPDGGVQERNIDYFEERAKGGCAAIFTGAFMCTEEFETRGCNVLYNFSHVDRLNLLVDKVHAHDCKLVVQLTAAGPHGATPIYPSTILCQRHGDLLFQGRIL